MGSNEDTNTNETSGLEEQHSPSSQKSSSFNNHQASEGVERDYTVSKRTRKSLLSEKHNQEMVQAPLKEIAKYMFTQTVTGYLLIVMWIVFLLQFLVYPLVFGGFSQQSSAAMPPKLWLKLFTLRGAHFEYLWTWITSMFSHGGVTHILANTVVFASFGVIVEKSMGKKRFLAFFITTGVISGIVQAYVFSFIGQGTAPILGASGAIAAVMGAFVYLKPQERVYFFFIIPMPMWAAIGVFGGGSLVLVALKGFGAFGMGNMAHLTGLALGLLYAIYTQIDSPGKINIGR